MSGLNLSLLGLEFATVVLLAERGAYVVECEGGGDVDESLEDVVLVGWEKAVEGDVWSDDVNDVVNVGIA